jgi:hypothetical protein
MAAPFVPFLKSGPSAAGHRPALQTDDARQSAAFVALSNAVSAQSQGAGQVSGPRGQGSGADAPHCASGTLLPAVTLEREGDRVTHIRIHCTCGQVVELECAY